MKKWYQLVKESVADIDTKAINDELSKLGSYKEYPISEVEDIIKGQNDKLYLKKDRVDEVDGDEGEGDSDMDFPIMLSTKEGEDEDTGMVANIKVDHTGSAYRVVSAKVS